MQTKIELQIDEIKKLIDTVHKYNLWADYDSLEYELYILASYIHDYVEDCSKMDVITNGHEIDEYKKLSTPIEGKKELSEEAKKRQIKITMQEELRLKGDIDADIERYKSYLRTFSRMADHFKSRFIKEMADAKRGDMVEQRG